MERAVRLPEICSDFWKEGTSNGLSGIGKTAAQGHILKAKDSQPLKNVFLFAVAFTKPSTVQEKTHQ